MNYVFKEKDIIITKLQNKISDTVYGQSHYVENKTIRTTKHNNNTNSDMMDSDIESERSMQSLAYLMHKSKVDEERTNRNKEDDVEYLSHSNTENLSGSSTTSIVNKCYEKSWKKGAENYVHHNDDEDFEREDEEMNEEEHQENEASNENEISQSNNYAYLYEKNNESNQNEDRLTKGSIKLRNKQLTAEKSKETEPDSSFQRRYTFSERELEQKRLWILQMK